MGIPFKLNTKSVTLDAEHGRFILPFDDANFPTRYYAMADDCQSYLKALQEKIKEIPEGDFRQCFMLNSEAAQYVTQKIDEAIGEGTSAAVFGEITPTIELLRNFFTAIKPYFDEYAASRKEFVERYRADRKGGSEGGNA